MDGFYYAGLVVRCLNSRYVEVDFRDFDRQVVSSRYVIAMQGARPCPSLKVQYPLLSVENAGYNVVGRVVLEGSSITGYAICRFLSRRCRLLSCTDSFFFISSFYKCRRQAFLDDIFASICGV